MTLRTVKVPVVVVGAGPNGVALANLLGLYGVQTLVLEKTASVLEYPRAVGMDDESLRLMQTAGLADELVQDMIQNVSLRMFKANGDCFANIRPTAKEFGWWRRNIFMQQLAEHTLRGGLHRYPHVELCLEQEVVALQQDAQGVTLTVQPCEPGSEPYQVQAEYVVAADGGRSPMREMLGVKLEGTTHPIQWVVVDVRNAHVDAPWTALNCDPRRPNVCIYLPYNYRRWEFMVFPHEDAEAIAQPESVRRLIAPYVKDTSQVEIVRARTYTHHSRVADRFLVGRVALVGDAAHLSPPWIGQGLNAGLRDVGNIAWKLAGIVKGSLRPEVLQTYQTERRLHSRAMIDLADTFGALLMPTSRIKAFLRDVFFGSVARLPGVRQYVLQMRFKPMPSYQSELVVADAKAGSPVGRMFIQPDVEDSAGVRRKLDDTLGPWYAVLGWECDPQAQMSAQTRAFWQAAGARFVQLRRARSGSDRQTRVHCDNGTVCLEDVDNSLADWFETQGSQVVILRPDRYIAAQGPAAALDALSARLSSMMKTPLQEATHVR